MSDDFDDDQRKIDQYSDRSVPEQLDFSDEREWIPFTWKDKGVVRNFIVREMDGGEVGQYNNSIKERTKIRSNKIMVDDFMDFESLLLTRCVFEVEGFEADGDNPRARYVGDLKKIDKLVVRRWGAKMVTKIHEKASTLSGLDEKRKKGKDDEGN